VPTHASRTAPSRQRTLRATLDRSYDLLPEPEQRLFRRLAVFAGSFGLEAVETVCASAGLAPGELLDLLARLVDTSLVVTEPGTGARTYRLLEPVRQYARSRLVDSGEPEAVHQRHATYYLGLAEQAEPELTGPKQRHWLGPARPRARQPHRRAAVATPAG
jgi:predicted ATPase